MRSGKSVRTLGLATTIVGIWLAIASMASSQDVSASWPQWRGPLGTGEAPKADPPVEWSETKNIKWKIKLPGHGSSTPVIWENLVLIHAAIPVEPPAEKKDEPKAEPGDEKPAAASIRLAQQAQEPEQPPTQEEPQREERPRREERAQRPGTQEPGRGPGGRGPGGPGGRGGRGGFGSQRPSKVHQFVVIAYDRATGKEVWQTKVKEELPHEGHHGDHGFSSHSPVTDGKHIVTCFGSRGLHCLDMKGNLLWSKDLGKMRTRAGFGEGSSPALHGNTIVVIWDHEGEDFIAAFDKVSGDELWRKERDEPTSWSTPLVVEHEGKAQVITAATNRIRSYDLKTGDLIWECAGLTTNAIPSPVHADGIVYATSGFRGAALLAIKLGATGDLTDTDAVLWKHDRSTPYVPSPLLYGKRIYFFKSNDATLSCFDITTGKALIDQERLSGLRGAYASPIGAADRVYLVGRNGTSMVIKNSDTLEKLATNVLDEPIDASPAAVGKELFLRGRESLYCIAE
jgi:outer membrane protein assembly factor BamB